MPTGSESLEQARPKTLWRFLDPAKIFGDTRFFEVMFFKRPTQFFLARNWAKHRYFPVNYHACIYRTRSTDPSVPIPTGLTALRIFKLEELKKIKRIKNKWTNLHCPAITKIINLLPIFPPPPHASELLYRARKAEKKKKTFLVQSWSYCNLVDCNHTG